VTTTPLHPAECFSWVEGSKVLWRYQLAYPTEAQWEVAACAGSTWIWGFGASPSALVGYANICWRGPDGEMLDPLVHPDPDGYSQHAPVGAFRPNAYGLHDMLGNVCEYCRDDYKVHYHDLKHSPGDALVVNDRLYDGEKSMRGGNFNSMPETLEVYYRVDRIESSSERTIGARPVWIPRSKMTGVAAPR